MLNQEMVVKKSPYKKTQTGKIVFISLAVGPIFAGYLLFTLYPNIMSVYYALLKWDGISKPEFIGLSNFIVMIKDQFMWNALFHNLIMLIVIPVFTVLISVFLADFLISKAFPENSFYKVLFFFPNVLSVVVLGLIWSFIYDGQFGFINALIKLLGFKNTIYWLGDKNTALVSVMISLIWINVAFYTIVILNAMSTIPKSLYESAILDGITNTKRLFLITVPLISGIIRVSVILMVTIIFKSFEMVLILTRGGPGGATDVIGNYMFNFAFSTSTYGGVTGTPEYGYASAIGMLLFVILVGSKLVIDRFFTQESVQY